MRGAQFGYDARTIIQRRLETLEAIGHPTSKVEVIVQGGTFPSRPWAHQEPVYRGIFDGLNGSASPSLEAAQRANETAAHRCVGLTVETRPDWCDARVLPRLLKAGVTRVEVGVECLREEVLAHVGRAHGTDDVARASRETRDRGLKLVYHVMLGLPGMDPARDVEDMRRMFADPTFCPDMLKIYPTLVLPDTALFEEWRRGDYVPYDAATAASVIAEVKRSLPPWVRIQRIQRDIPARLIAAGVREGNLRQRALALLAAEGRRCPCLRCREVGRRAAPSPERFVPVRREYPASGGREVFLSFEEPESEAVAGFLRLRFPSEVTEGGLDDPVIREVKVLGSELAVGAPSEGGLAYQHRGFGRLLVRRAEEEARAQGRAGLYVMSAVGTREYYARLGFERAGPHLRKPLRAGT